jgi:tripartite-type tricarboxylate transporter receptor subunit TctC
MSSRRTPHLPQRSRTLARLAGAALLVAAAFAQAQTFPNRPVRILVGFPVGSSPDIVARAVGDDVAKTWNQPVVVENRAGADAILATEAAAKAASDGYTIYLATLGALALNPHLFEKLPYDPVRDFTGVVFVAENPFAIAIQPKLPVRTVPELVAHTKANPNKTSYGSAGSFGQMLGEAFKRRSGADITLVPYKGVQQAVTDFIGGQVEAVFADLPSILPQHKAGTARILAVTTATRSPVASDIPTMIESGVAGFDYATWYAFVAPAKTPRDVVDKLNADIARTLAKKEIRDRLLALGLDAKPGKPDDVTKLVPAEIAKWEPVVKAAGIQKR